MGEYQDNLKDEKRPSGIIPAGHRQVRIIELIDGVSKGGNKMFTGTIEDIETRTTMLVWLVNEPKKRWMLKSLLSACQLPAAEDGVYDWSKSDVIGKQVTVIVEHVEEEYINREGNTAKAKKAKVNEFLPADLTVKEQHNGNDIQW